MPDGKNRHLTGHKPQPYLPGDDPPYPPMRGAACLTEAGLTVEKCPHSETTELAGLFR